MDARAKIGEEKYQIWLDEIGITQNQSQKIENFFNATFEEIKSEYPCEGTQELIQLFALIENNENLSPFCQFDPKIMRGLDYYTGMIFEVYDQSPDNNRSMFGGGRYDNLVGLFGKESISGVGFGMGDVTLKNFCETYKLFPDFGRTLDVYVTLTEESHKTYMHKVADLLRNLPSQPLKVATALTASKFGQQLKTADKLKAKFVAIIGEDKIQKQCVSLKNLLTGDQTQVKLEDLEKVNFNL